MYIWVYKKQNVISFHTTKNEASNDYAVLTDPKRQTIKAKLKVISTDLSLKAQSICNLHGPSHNSINPFLLKYMSQLTLVQSIYIL